MTRVISEAWRSPTTGNTYPAGTVFMRSLDNPEVWDYVTPNGGRGTAYLGKNVPNKRGVKNGCA